MIDCLLVCLLVFSHIYLFIYSFESDLVSLPGSEHQSLRSINSFDPRWGSADASLEIVHVIDSRQRSSARPHQPHTHTQSPNVNICEAPATNTGLDSRAATVAASAPTEMSTLRRMIKPRVRRLLCVHERAHLTPSADSRSACEPSANATVLLLVNTHFKSANCSRCHAAQAGRCGGQRAQHKQNCRSAVTVTAPLSPAGLPSRLFPRLTN